MHNCNNCKMAHSHKPHRRRNRALRRALAPLHWFDQPLAVSGERGRGMARRRVSTLQSAMASAAFSGPAPMPAREDRVQVYQPSAIRRWAAGLRRFVPSLARKPSA